MAWEKKLGKRERTETHLCELDGAQTKAFNKKSHRSVVTPPVPSGGNDGLREKRFFTANRNLWLETWGEEGMRTPHIHQPAYRWGGDADWTLSHEFRKTWRHESGDDSSQTTTETSHDTQLESVTKNPQIKQMTAGNTEQHATHLKDENSFNHQAQRSLRVLAAAC